MKKILLILFLVIQSYAVGFTATPLITGSATAAAAIASNNTKHKDELKYYEKKYIAILKYTNEDNLSKINKFECIFDKNKSLVCTPVYNKANGILITIIKIILVGLIILVFIIAILSLAGL
jgi:uncharacterized membrane protein (DUF485 family)